MRKKTWSLSNPAKPVALASKTQTSLVLEQLSSSTSSSIVLVFLISRSVRIKKTQNAVILPTSEQRQKHLSVWSASIRPDSTRRGDSSKLQSLSPDQPCQWARGNCPSPVICAAVTRSTSLISQLFIQCGRRLAQADQSNRAKGKVVSFLQR